MVLLFPVFFGVLAAAAVLYGILTLRERMRPEERTICVLDTRMREKFPNLTLVGRRDKVDYTLIFRTETGEKIPVSVTKAVYKAIPKERLGVLYYQGSRFGSFTFDGITIRANHVETVKPKLKPEL